MPGRRIRNLAAWALWPLVIVTALAALQWLRHVFGAVHSPRNLLWWCAGFLAWTVVFLVGPAPMRAYILGHELSHVLWTWLLGGRVRNLRIDPSAGSVEVSVHSIWVALAPYLVPFYAILVVLAFGIVQMLCDRTADLPAWYALLGASWAFHVTFTASMMRRGQPDLESVGWSFSVAIISIVNLLLFVWILAWIADVPLRTWWLIWWDHVQRWATIAWNLYRRAVGAR